MSKMIILTLRSVMFEKISLQTSHRLSICRVCCWFSFSDCPMSSSPSTFLLYLALTGELESCDLVTASVAWLSATGWGSGCFGMCTTTTPDLSFLRTLITLGAMPCLTGLVTGLDFLA